MLESIKNFNKILLKYKYILNMIKYRRTYGNTPYLIQLITQKNMKSTIDFRHPIL